MEIAQSDAAAAIDWLRTETYKAHERPQSEVTGNKSDNYVRREPGTAGMKGGVRYSIYEAADGLVMFMASEQEFWKNFCEGVGRMDMFEKWPGSKYADHAKGNREMQAELRDIFKTKTMQEWIEFSKKVNTAIAPVHTAQTLMEDPQFKERFEWIPKERLGAEQLPTPIKLVGDELPLPEKAPTVGQHTDSVLTEVLGYDDVKIKALKESGALGA
jgi:crotonobetainyl-CoA:carnitine CoA-transferase CaiB-like acyl-CoA transferase